MMLTFGITRHFSGLTFHRPGLRNIVPDNAPFTVACRQGDLVTMKNLALQGQASYFDVTRTT